MYMKIGGRRKSEKQAAGKKTAGRKRMVKKLLATLGGAAVVTIGCLFAAFTDSPEDLLRAKYDMLLEVPGNVKGKLESALPVDEDGYYEIRTASDYRAFWKKAVLHSNIKGRMMNDIYLNDTGGWELWYKNPPENVSSPVEYFAGIFDGNGYTLYGLYSDSRYGMVRMNGGSILNLTIKESLVTGEYSNSGICYYNDALISGCRFNGEVWSSRTGKRAGICIENGGTIAKCGFSGNMRAAWSRSDKAGICTKNRGVIKDCYNFSRRSKDLYGTCYAITDKGEVNCYVKEGAGWDIFPENQVTELSREQVFYLVDLLNGDFYSFFRNNDNKAAWMCQLQNMQEDLVLKTDSRKQNAAGVMEAALSKLNPSDANLFKKMEDSREELLDEAMLKKVFEDEMMSFLIFRLTEEKTALPAQLDLTPSQNRDEGSDFQIDMTSGGSMVEVSAFPAEHLNEDCRMLWQVCGGLLGCDEENWEHRTYKLAAGSKDETAAYPAKELQKAILMLYQTAGGGEGFFYITEEMIYRMELRDRENTALYEEIFGELCSNREMENGILWEDGALRQAVLCEAEKELGIEAQKLSSEEIMGITSLSIEHAQEIRSFRDLAYLQQLTSLVISGDGQDEGQEKVEIRIANVLPNLQELTIDNCRLGGMDFLGRLPNLKELYMEDCACQENDGSFLGKLPQLEVLEINNMTMTDISFLENMPGLRRLSLEGNGLTDISPIAFCGNLEELSLSDNEVEDTEPLTGLSKLKNLDLSYNNITDIHAIGAFSHLRNLNLGYNQISDISVLNELRELTWLRIDGNKVKDLEPIQERDGLAIRYTIAYY